MVSSCCLLCLCHPWVTFPVGNEWASGKGSLAQPMSLAQLFSTPDHKLSITQDQATTVLILVDLNRELKMLGNRKDESTRFSKKLMALQIETRQFLEGEEEGTSRFSLLTAVLIAVQWVLQSETLRPA